MPGLFRIFAIHFPRDRSVVRSQILLEHAFERPEQFRDGHGFAEDRGFDFADEGLEFGILRLAGDEDEAMAQFRLTPSIVA